MKRLVHAAKYRSGDILEILHQQVQVCIAAEGLVLCREWPLSSVVQEIVRDGGEYVLLAVSWTIGKECKWIGHQSLDPEDAELLLVDIPVMPLPLLSEIWPVEHMDADGLRAWIGAEAWCRLSESPSLQCKSILVEMPGLPGKMRLDADNGHGFDPVELQLKLFHLLASAGDGKALRYQMVRLGVDSYLPTFFLDAAVHPATDMRVRQGLEWSGESRQLATGSSWWVRWPREGDVIRWQGRVFRVCCRDERVVLAEEWPRLVGASIGVNWVPIARCMLPTLQILGHVPLSADDMRCIRPDLPVRPLPAVPIVWPRHRVDEAVVAACLGEMDAELVDRRCVVRCPEVWIVPRADSISVVSDPVLVVADSGHEFGGLELMAKAMSVQSCMGLRAVFCSLVRVGVRNVAPVYAVDVLTEPCADVWAPYL
jgi:hypothetical protein